MNSLLRKIVSSKFYKKLIRMYKERDELINYWKNVNDSCNAPELYMDKYERSEFLYQLIQQYINPNSKILEIGCNVGRNLLYLYERGYSYLEGIEVNEKAVRIFYNKLYHDKIPIRIFCSPVENIIKAFPDKFYDMTFTMAVLEHIHPDSEWIFDEMVRITKSFILTIEDEKASSWRCFPRNYKKIFEKRGCCQIHEIYIGERDLFDSDSFVARFFKIE